VRPFAEIERYAEFGPPPPDTGFVADAAPLGNSSTRSIQRSAHSRNPIAQLGRWRSAPLMALVCGLLSGLSACGGFRANGTNIGTLVASPGTIAFGSAPVGKTASATVLLLNEGTAPLEITQLGLTGNSFSIAGQSNLPIAISAGATYQLNMQFAPAASGTTAGQLTVTSNSSAGNTTIISLSGTGVASTPDVATLVASPGTVTFGNVSVGQTANATVLLSNQGSAPLQITQLALNGQPFSYPGQNNLPITVAAGGSYSLNLHFNPAASGTAAGQLTVTSNSSTGTTTTINLSGTGIASTADVATLDVSPGAVAFGNVSVGQTASATVVLSNQGSGQLKITQLGLNGQSFSFAGQNNLPITVVAGGTYSLNLHFDPATLGTAAGQLTLTSNSSTGTTTVIGLSGTAIAPTIANVSIGNTPGQAIPATFMGLSHEWGTAATMMGDSTTGVDNIYRQLLRNLTAYGSGPIHLRIGGASTDQTGEPTPTTAQPFAELASDLGVRFYLGVNLGTDNVNLAVDQAKAYVSQMPPGSLDAIEIGNEPDQYAQNGIRSSSYGYEDYLADFNTWKTNITPVLPTGTRLMGPSWAGFGWWPNIKTYDSSEVDALTTFSQHYYVASAKAQNPADILLTPGAATNGPSAVAAGVATAHQYGIPFRMGEMNSLSGGGKLGISNAFESALWAIDNMFEYANVGVDGVNWHGGGGPYTYFSIYSAQKAGVSTFTLAAVNPLYYGLLFFQAATGNGAHLLPVTLDTLANLKAWATIDASSTPRLVLINKDENLTGTVDITLSGYSHAQIYRLTAPSYQSTSGVTFAGQTFDGSTNGAIQGAQTVESVDVSDGVFEVSIPVTSAVLVVFTN
jgi:hypothetical protein